MMRMGWMTNGTGLQTGVIAALLGIILSVAVPGFAADADATAQAVLTQQETYFQTITSMVCDLETVQIMTDQCRERRKLPSARLQTRMRFVSSGSKYRSEVTFTDAFTGKERTVISCYDGVTYQQLHSGSGTRPLLVVSRTKRGDNPYYGLHPLVALWTWALSDTDDLSLSPLEKSAKWAALTQAVQSADNATVTGRDQTAHNGVTMALRVPLRGGAGVASCDVFFDSGLGYLPTHWRAALPDGRASECEVVAVQTLDLPTGQFHFPARIEGKDYSTDGMVEQEGYIQVDVRTLDVNGPVDEAAFTIPIASAYRYVDEDTGVVVKPGVSTNQGN